jgi:membrane-associated protein
MEQILKFISIYGYLFIFCALFAENTVFVGLIMPGETVLFAGAFAASNGYLNVYIVFTVACLAAILGNIGGYLIGYFSGRSVLEKYGNKFSAGKLVGESEEYFKKHGKKTVFIGRFAAGIRVFVAALAGASRMDFGLFLFYTVASVFLWTLGITLLGYFFGSHYKLILLISKRFSIILLVIIVILITIFLWRRGYGKKQNPGKFKK